MTGASESDHRPPPWPPPAQRPSRGGHLGLVVVLGVVLGVLAAVFVITAGAEVPGGTGSWVAFLLVVAGSVMGYRWAVAKGHRDLGIGLLISIAAGFVAGFGAFVAYQIAMLYQNFQ